MVLVYSPDRPGTKFACQALKLQEFARRRGTGEFVKNGARGDTPEDQAWRASIRMRHLPPHCRGRVGGPSVAAHHLLVAGRARRVLRCGEELERLYRFLGGWTTIGTGMDIVAVESVLGDSAPAQVNQDGSFLLPVKAASNRLGLSIAKVYEPMNCGEIAHVTIGSRRYISRDQTSAFIEATLIPGTAWYYRRE